MRAITQHLALLCCVGFSLSASADPGEMRVQGVPPASGQGRSLLSAAASTTFRMQPSVILPSQCIASAGTSPYGLGPQTLRFGVFCYDVPSNSIVPNCDVRLDWSANAGSGGHIHNTQRPQGKLESDNGVVAGSVDSAPPEVFQDNTGSTGILYLTYTAPNVSGITTLTLSGSAINNGRPEIFYPVNFTIGVGYDGLSPASGSGLLVLRQSSMHDSNNGYASQAMTVALQGLSTSFGQAEQKAGETAPDLVITAISLPEGGLFDFANEWSPPHCEHRFGNQADVATSSLSDQERQILARYLGDNGISTPVRAESPTNPAANHWHLTVP